ncbi:MAG: 3-dehydroquinate synthase [Chloroflexi bacterium]|nr:3-dehydroquinate synthase [Chloroflexota bacterium]
MDTLDYIQIERGASGRLAQVLDQEGLPPRAWVIADTTVMQLHGQRIVGELTQAGVTVESRAVPPGESSKSVAAANELWAWLAEQGAERGDPIIALGGGVVGDLAGFVAAAYLRGVPLIQVPTTLLAQIDSSVGGKVAVDLAAGKNLVGAFYPARQSVIDPDLLATLPHAQLVADYAEVIKTAMIFDAGMFELIERRVDELDDTALLEELVTRCVRWKARIVDEDPHDRGARAVLNYGHTIAHALETVCGYGAYRHGEAVAIGMRGAAAISVRVGALAAADAVRQHELLRHVGLSQSYMNSAPDDLLQAMQRDKKVRGGRIQWVLAERIGAASPGHHVNPHIVRDVLHELRAPAA